MVFRKELMIGLVALLLVAGCAQQATTDTVQTGTPDDSVPPGGEEHDGGMMEDTSMTDDSMADPGDAMDGQMGDMMDIPDVTFVVEGENFRFLVDGEESPTLRVKEGQRVRVEFSSVSGFHDWAVEGFNAATSRVRETDGMTFVEFVADRKGTFAYYCSVGSHRANGMEGSLIVE